MNRQVFLDKMEAEFIVKINKYFPEHFLGNFGYSDASFHAYLSNHNKYLKSTQYYYNQELTFIHWTSVSNLMSILNNREIRLYNLINSEDVSEFNFAAKSLGIKENEIEAAKKNYFTFSFCKFDDIHNPYLWEHYGNKHKGVAIKISIQNNPEDWFKYMISQVYYELSPNFKKFKTAINLFEQKNNISTKFYINELLGFHKKNAFKKENEVRIAIYHPYTHADEYRKLVKTELRLDDIKRKRISNYIALPLWVDNNAPIMRSNWPQFDRKSSFDEEFFKNKPKIKLENIYFGKNCGLTNIEYNNYRQELMKIISLNFGYRIELNLNLYNPERPLYP